VPPFLFYGDLNLNTTIPLGVNISSSGKLLIQLFANASVSVGVAIHLLPTNSNVTLSLSSVDVSGLYYGSLSNAVPKYYRDQIMSENWGEIIMTVNKLIETHLALPLNKVLETPVLDVVSHIFSDIVPSKVGDFIQISGIVAF